MITLKGQRFRDLQEVEREMWNLTNLKYKKEIPPVERISLIKTLRETITPKQ